MRVRSIQVATSGGSYLVRIEHGLLDSAGRHVAAYARGGRIVVVSDEAVWAAQGKRLTAGLASAGIEPLPVLVQPGESSKSWDVLTDLIDRLLALEVGRGDHVLAFGGGVVGDLAGFAASILKRGCGVVQMPTSLLAQVDSAVGGKTAINVAAGKNLVGTFHQPALVLIDPATLDTLPPRELRAGYAEIVKYGLIGDPGFFAWCECNGAALIAGDGPARLHAIATSVGAKAAIVAQDERETGGRRALLNLGHTFGHAIEAEAGYSGRLLHGEAVAMGLVLAFRFSAELGLCPPQEADRVAAHLEAVGLPIRCDMDAEALICRILHDKKASGGALPFILARGIGVAFLERSVDLADVRRFLERARAW